MDVATARTTEQPKCEHSRCLSVAQAATTRKQKKEEAQGLLSPPFPKFHQKFPKPPLGSRRRTKPGGASSP
eukprot:CAMPEP_0194582868 /NCGR_PEP_ID=MMETSP0292-20121207/15925_1 /TAXON_ID=39354 /ORGANISM="Heterosigma akashiwo, Strain CCMP2393" /LENGTH=70 /DNA_ID=CAMNT_0039437231 /DNA_START=135 /DNA_END=343 /DNA_ORIENTATION=-